MSKPTESNQFWHESALFDANEAAHNIRSRLYSTITCMGSVVAGVTFLIDRNPIGLLFICPAVVTGCKAIDSWIDLPKNLDHLAESLTISGYDMDQ